MPTVLVVDRADVFVRLRRACEANGLTAQHADDARTALAIAARAMPALVVTNHAVGDRAGAAWIAELRRALPDALVAVVVEPPAVAAGGADLVLAAPLDDDAIERLVQVVAMAPDPRRSLLVVEPDPQLGTVIRRWLGRSYDVTIVTSASRALAAIRAVRPDVVIAELRLPDLDAPELHAALDREGLADRTLYMTAGFVPDRAQQFLAQIPRQWIHKPFDLARLHAAVAVLLRARPGGA